MNSTRLNMSVETAFERLEALLGDIRTRMERLEERLKPEPTCFTYPDAAVRLGVGLTKMKLMVKGGEIRTVRVGKVPMIPASEIQRVAALDLPPLPPNPKRKGLAQTQNPDALRRRRR